LRGCRCLRGVRPSDFNIGPTFAWTANPKIGSLRHDSDRKIRSKFNFDVTNELEHSDRFNFGKGGNVPMPDFVDEHVESMKGLDCGKALAK